MLVEKIFEISLFLYALVLIIIVHEIGHYIFYRLFGHKPDIKIKDGLFLVGDNVIGDVSLFEYLIIASAGILGGLIPLYLYFDHDLSLLLPVYLIMCSYDFAGISHALVQLKKHGPKMKLCDVLIKDAIDILWKYHKV